VIKKIKNILPIILIAFSVPLPVLFWLPKDEVLAHGPVYPWPSVSGLLRIVGHHLFSWNPLGQNFDFTSSLFYFYSATATFLGGNAHTGQLLFLYFGFLACFVGMFVLAQKLGFSLTASMISGIFYIFTPAVMSGMPLEPVNLRVLPFYVSCPILLYIFIKLISEKDYFKNLFWLGTVTIFICSPAYSSLQYFVLHLLMIAIYAFVDFVITKRDKKRHFLYFGKVILGIILIIFSNFYWLFPMVGNLGIAYAGRKEMGFEEDHDFQMVNTTSSKIIDSLRLLPYKTQVYSSPWLKFYYSPFIIFLTFAFVVFAIMTLIFKKTRKLAFFPLILFIVSLFLEKGIKAPFGVVGKIIFLSFPYVTRLFRNLTYFNLLVIFSFSLLIGLGLGELVRLLSIKLRQDFPLKHFLILITLSLLMIYGWPYMNGSSVSSQKETGLSQTIKVPKSFIELSQFINDQKIISSFLEIPVFTQQYFFTAYSWGRTYSGAPLLSSWTNKFLINSFVEGGENRLITEALHPRESSISPEAWLRVLQYTNAKNIIYYKDSDWSYLNKIYPDYKSEEIESFLNNNFYISQIMKFGEKINLYELNSKYYIPRFYIPRQSIYLNDEFSGLNDIVHLTSFNNRSVLYPENILDSSRSKDLINQMDEIFVRGKLENAIPEDELEILSEEMILPSVRQKPGSLFYFLVLKKEEYDKWMSRKDPKSLLGKHLFYAGKRINEIITFNIDRLANYENEMVKAIKILEKLKNDNPQDFLTLLTKLEETFWFHQKKIYEANLDKELEKKSKDVFINLSDKINGLKIKRDFTKFVYKLETPKEGEYEIFVRDNAEDKLLNTEKPSFESSDLANLLDTSESVASPSWKLLESKYFSQGSHKYVLPNGIPYKNLVSDNLKINDYSPSSIYKISFSYKAPRVNSDKLPFLSVNESGAEKLFEKVLLPTNNKFENFEMFFRSSSKANKAFIFLSVTEYKDLKIERIYQPEIMLKYKTTEDKILNTGKQVSKITFVKINPTKYKVKVEGAREPYTLVFSESFHQGWKAFISGQRLVTSDQYGEIVASYFDGEIKEGTHKNIFLDRSTFGTWSKKPLSEDKHFLVNGYANSWRISPDDVEGAENYELIIEFRPQRWFYLGLGISGLTLSGCLGCLVWGLIKAKN